MSTQTLAYACSRIVGTSPALPRASGTCLIAVAAGVLLVTTPLHSLAAPIEGVAAFSLVSGSCAAGAEGSESISTPILYVPVSVSCDVSGTDSTSVGSTQAVAQALTTFGYPAAADVQTSVKRDRQGVGHDLGHGRS